MLATAGQKPLCGRSFVHGDVLYRIIFVLEAAETLEVFTRFTTTTYSDEGETASGIPLRVQLIKDLRWFNLGVGCRDSFDNITATHGIFLAFGFEL